MRFLILALLILTAPILTVPLAFAEVAAPAATADAMAPYRTLAQAALAAVNAKDFAAAKAKWLELEKSWDDGTAELKKSEKATWKTIDKQLDVALDQLKAAAPDAAKAAAEIQVFIDKLKLAK